MNEKKNLTTEETFALAIQNHKKNNLQVAENLYNETLKINPNYAGAHNNLGIVLNELGKYKKAMSSYEKAIQIQPNYAAAHYNLGNTLKELEEHQKAISCYEKVIQINPNHVDAHNNLGLAFYALGEHQKAMSSYEKAIQINPNYAGAHNNLGLAFYALGEHQKAMSSYEKAVQINPNYAGAHNNLGIVLNELREYQKAISCYEKVIQIQPNYVDAHYNLGNTLKELEKHQKAMSSYEKAIQINPNHVDAHNNLGIVLNELEEHQKAISCYEKVIQINPNHVDAHNNLGLAFYKLREFQKAINCFEKVLIIDPKNKEINYNLGKIYQEGLGNQKQAVENYQKTLINRSEINFEIDKEKDQKLDPATVFFFLELTNKCNFHCEFCPSDSQTRLHGYMELSLVKKIFDEISQKKIVPQVALHLMGEPTLHPKLNEILVYARSKNVKIALTTNGSTLVKKKVPKLLESISGKIVASLMTPTKKTYKIRGDVRLSWDRYIDNFRLLIQEHLKKISRDDKIEYQIIIRIMVTSKAKEGATKVLESSKDIQESYNEWSNFVETTEKELGLKPFTRPKIDSAKTFSILSEYEEISYNLQKNIKIQFWRAFTFANSRVRDEYKLLPQEKTQYCPHPFTDFGVLWNGDVSLCCLDYDGTLKVGNVKNHSVEDVLKSMDSKKLRASMYGLEKLHPTCQKCQSRPVEK